MHLNKYAEEFDLEQLLCDEHIPWDEMQQGLWREGGKAVWLLVETLRKKEAGIDLLSLDQELGFGGPQGGEKVSLEVYELDGEHANGCFEKDGFRDSMERYQEFQEEIQELQKLIRIDSQKTHQGDSKSQRAKTTHQKNLEKAEKGLEKLEDSFSRKSTAEVARGMMLVVKVKPQAQRPRGASGGGDTNSKGMDLVLRVELRGTRMDMAHNPLTGEMEGC